MAYIINSRFNSRVDPKQIAKIRENDQIYLDLTCSKSQAGYNVQIKKMLQHFEEIYEKNNFMHVFINDSIYWQFERVYA
jgi:hypothetical protein